MDYSVNLRNQQQSVKKVGKVSLSPARMIPQKKKNIFLLPRRQFDADFMRDFKA